MLKFLRKYNKIILVVGGSLLMVAFLLPQALTELGRSTSGAVYRVGGRKVSQQDLISAGYELAALQRVVGAGGFNGQVVLQALGVPSSPDDWAILTLEAERRGFVGESADGEGFIPELAEFVGQQAFYQQYRVPVAQLDRFPGAQAILDQTISDVATGMTFVLGAIPTDRTGSPAQTRLALAKLRGVLRMASEYMNAPRISRVRAIAEGKNQLDNVSVDAVVIRPERVLAEVPDPTEEELSAFYELHRDEDPGSGEYGFGYVQPIRIKLEYMVIDRSDIEARVPADRIEVQKRLLRAQAAAEETPEQLAERIAGEVKSEAVSRVLTETARAIASETARATRRLESSGAFRVVPADWDAQRPRFDAMRDAVVQRVREATGVEIDPPMTISIESKWLTQNDLSQLEGIGQSFIVRARGQQMGFPALAMNVHELVPDAPVELQAGIPYGQASEDAEGNRYFFTVLAARTASPPDSIDEVREKVVEDWKRLRAFERLRDELDAYVAAAAGGGLAEVQPEPEGDAALAPADMVQKGVRIYRTRATLPALSDEPVARRVHEFAEVFDPTRGLDDVPAADRMLGVEAPKQQSIAVVLVTGVTPLTVEQFRSQAVSIASTLRSGYMLDLRDEVFARDSLWRRMNVRTKSGKPALETPAATD